MYLTIFVNVLIAAITGYRSVQTKLLDMINSYDTWRQDGFVQSMIISNFLKVPSKRLVAKIGETEYTGEEALKKMKQIVLAGQAVDAYKTGVMEPLKVK